MKNGCCVDCMKAFSKSGKSCLCQVPSSQRRAFLPARGCKICHCHGCNPVDIQRSKRDEFKNKLRQDGYGKFSRKRQRLLDSDDDLFDPNDSGFVSLGAGNSNKQFDDWNRAKKQFSEYMAELTQMNTLLLGIGCPIRHHSYIFGRPAEGVSQSSQRQYHQHPSDGERPSHEPPKY